MHLVRSFAAPSPFEVGCLDVPTGSVMRVIAPSGRTLVARATSRSQPGSELSPSTVGLDLDHRSELRVHIGDHVRIEPCELPPATSVVVAPTFPVDLSSQDETQLVTMLIDARPALQLGARFRVPFGTSGATGVFQVVEIDTRSRGGAGIASSDSRIVVRSPTTQELVGFSTDAALADVGGMHDVLPKLREAIELPLTNPSVYRELGIVPPRGVLLHGPPGAGKTFVARALAREVGANFEYVSGPELVGISYGRTEANLRQVFADAARKAPSVVLIDEIDALAPNRGHLGAQADYRMVTQLLSLMDGLRQVDGIIVLGTTNRPDALDPAMRRPGRLDVEIFVAPPARDERAEILCVYFNRMPLTDAARSHITDIAERTHGFLPADLMALTRQAGLHALGRQVRLGLETVSDVKIHVADLDAAASDITPSLLRGAAVRLPEVTFDDLHGHEVVRAAVEELVGRAGRDRRHAAVLLSGPSGSGKTALSHAIADFVGAHLIQVSPVDLFTSWLGESEEAVRALFRMASYVAPTVIVLDHLDGLAPVGPDVGAASRRVITQLLRELDDLPPDVHVIATVENPAMVDGTVVRRFTTSFSLALPSAAERRSFLDRFGDALSATDRDTLVAAADGETYEELRRRAARVRR